MQLDEQFVVEIEAVALEPQAVRQSRRKTLNIVNGSRSRCQKSTLTSVVKNQWPRFRKPLSSGWPVNWRIFQRCAAVARAEDEGVATGDERFEQRVVVLEIVFEVGILDQNEVAGGGGEAGAHGVAFSARASSKMTITRGCSANSCAISRVPSVELLSTTTISISIPAISFAMTRSASAESGGFIEGGHDDGKARVADSAALREKTIMPLATIRRRFFSRAAREACAGAGGPRREERHGESFKVRRT